MSKPALRELNVIIRHAGDEDQHESLVEARGYAFSRVTEILKKKENNTEK